MEFTSYDKWTTTRKDGKEITVQKYYSSRNIIFYPTSDDYYDALERYSEKKFDNYINNDKYISTPSCAIHLKHYKDIYGEEISNEIRKAYLAGFNDGAQWGNNKDWIKNDE